MATANRQAAFWILNDVFDRLDGQDALYWKGKEFVGAMELTAPAIGHTGGYEVEWLELVDRLTQRSVIDEATARRLGSLP